MSPEIESRIQTILQAAGTLPTLPGVALRILDVVQQEDTGLKEVGDVLRSDPPLATKVLQLANSSLFGTKVSSVQHAVNILGGELVKNLVLGFSLIRNTRADNTTFFNYEQFWKESLVTAISSRWILQRRAPQLKENGFILGLIHNIGSLFLVQCMPWRYSRVMEEVQEGTSSQHEAEERHLGVSHFQVGSYLAGQWGFPDSLTLPIAYHHHPDLLPQDGNLRILTETLHFATQFSSFFHSRKAGYQLAVLEHMMQAYGLDELFHLNDLVNHVQEQTRDLFPIFELSLQDDLSYLQIVEEARQELIHTSHHFIQDYLAQQREIERLRILASHDPLTRLHNHQKFSEELDAELERVQRTGGCFSCCFVDLDDFKAVNDTHGHLAGDRVLQRIAQHLQNNVRKYDTVARYGGDEFVLIMPELSASKAFRALERIREFIADNPTLVNDTPISLTVSCGVLHVSPQTAADRDEVMKQVDATMYEAKHAKNKTVICRS